VINSDDAVKGGISSEEIVFVESAGI